MIFIRKKEELNDWDKLECCCMTLRTYGKEIEKGKRRKNIFMAQLFSLNFECEDFKIHSNSKGMENVLTDFMRIFI